jgi:23S rRNA pseudouridine2605 synthase
MLLLFNKPKGYVVSMSDPHNPTVYELLPEEFHQYYYIGRLDKESRGLLLFTNTSALVHRYEHPRFALEKEYVIQLSSPLSKQALEQAKR